VTGQPGVDGEAIRALVREVLADLLPAASRDPGNPGNLGGAGSAGLGAAVPGGPATAPGGPAQDGLPHTVREHVESVEVVSIRTDADLAGFVLHLLHLFENPKHRDALRSGRLRFRLSPATASSRARSPRRSSPRAPAPAHGWCSAGAPCSPRSPATVPAPPGSRS